MADVKKKVKKDNKLENTERRIQAEIKKCTKKLEKLLRLHEENRLRWKLNRKGKRVELKVPKTQGIIKGSKRYIKLVEHIEKLKSQV